LCIEVNDPTDVPMAESAAFAVAAEQAGIDGVGMPDHQHLGRDVFLRLAHAAAATQRITLFPSVTNPITRHPTVIASLANALGESHPGRVRIMLGAGDIAVSHISHPAATVAEMREAVTAIRAILRGEPATINGARVPGVAHPCDEPPLVYVNASSPRMLAVAGEVADGVYAMTGVHPEIIAKAREHVAEGARRGGRPPESVPIALGLPVSLGATHEEAVESARPYVFSYLSRANRLFSRVMREAIPDIPPLATPADIPAAALAPLAAALGLVGTPQTCVDRFAELVSATGFDHYVCRVSYAGVTPLSALDTFAHDVVPEVRRRAA
jgi:5,10-methylenetetrahydromethanopterin reductase